MTLWPLFGERIQTEAKSKVFGIFRTFLITFVARMNCYEIVRSRLRKDELRRRVFDREILGTTAIDAFVNSWECHH